MLLFAILGTRLKLLHDTYTAYVCAMDIKTKATFALYITNKFILYNPDGECSLRSTHESLHKTLVCSPEGQRASRTLTRRDYKLFGKVNRNSSYYTPHVLYFITLRISGCRLDGRK